MCGLFPPVPPQVFFSSSTMRDIIAPAAAQAASKKDPVRMACNRQGPACGARAAATALVAGIVQGCAYTRLHILHALCAAGAGLHAPGRR